MDSCKYKLIKSSIKDVKSNKKTLTRLSLKGIDFGNDNAFLLAEALAYNNTLTQLNLSWCRIGIKGVKMFENALKTNFTLIKLNLGQGNLAWARQFETIDKYLARNLKIVND